MTSDNLMFPVDLEPTRRFPLATNFMWYPKKREYQNTMRMFHNSLLTNTPKNNGEVYLQPEPVRRTIEKLPPKLKEEIAGVIRYWQTQEGGYMDYWNKLFQYTADLNNTDFILLRRFFFHPFWLEYNVFELFLRNFLFYKVRLVIEFGDPMILSLEQFMNNIRSFFESRPEFVEALTTQIFRVDVAAKRLEVRPSHRLLKAIIPMWDNYVQSKFNQQKFFEMSPAEKDATDRLIVYAEWVVYDRIQAQMLAHGLHQTKHVWDQCRPIEDHAERKQYIEDHIRIFKQTRPELKWQPLPNDTLYSFRKNRTRLAKMTLIVLRILQRLIMWKKPDSVIEEFFKDWPNARVPELTNEMREHKAALEEYMARSGRTNYVIECLVGDKYLKDYEDVE